MGRTGGSPDTETQTGTDKNGVILTLITVQDNTQRKGQVPEYLVGFDLNIEHFYLLDTVYGQKSSQLIPSKVHHVMRFFFFTTRISRNGQESSQRLFVHFPKKYLPYEKLPRIQQVSNLSRWLKTSGYRLWCTHFGTNPKTKIWFEDSGTKQTKGGYRGWNPASKKLHGLGWLRCHTAKAAWNLGTLTSGA